MERATLAILALLLALGAVTAYQIHSLAPLVRETPVKVRLTEMQTHTSTWVSGGITHTLTTTRESGENSEAFLARHNAALDEALELYPVDQ